MNSPSNDKDIRVVQLSDLHLCQSESMRIFGVNTYQKASRLFKRLKEISCDFLCITGDLSNDGSFESYKLLKNLLEENFYTHSVHLIGGNHDNQFHRSCVLGDYKKVTYEKIGNWVFIFLETAVQNRDYGYITDSLLRETEKIILDYPGKYIALFTHHHFWDIGDEELDSYKVLRSNTFLDLLAINPNIRIVSSGHVHQESHCNA